MSNQISVVCMDSNRTPNRNAILLLFPFSVLAEKLAVLLAGRSPGSAVGSDIRKFGGGSKLVSPFTCWMFRLT